MPQSGRIIFTKMDEVVFGKPAAKAVAYQARRLNASRVLLLVSGTLNRETREIENVCKALGNRHGGTFDAILPNTPRQCVIAAADQARDSKADLIVTIAEAPSPTAQRRFSFVSPTTCVRRRRSMRCVP